MPATTTRQDRLILEILLARGVGYHDWSIDCARAVGNEGAFDVLEQWNSGGKEQGAVTCRERSGGTRLDLLPSTAEDAFHLVALSPQEAEQWLKKEGLEDGPQAAAPSVAASEQLAVVDPEGLGWADESDDDEETPIHKSTEVPASSNPSAGAALIAAAAATSPPSPPTQPQHQPLPALPPPVTSLKRSLEDSTTPPAPSSTDRRPAQCSLAHFDPDRNESPVLPLVEPPLTRGPEKKKLKIDIPFSSLVDKVSVQPPDPRLPRPQRPPTRLWLGNLSRLSDADQVKEFVASSVGPDVVVRASSFPMLLDRSPTSTLLADIDKRPKKQDWTTGSLSGGVFDPEWVITNLNGRELAGQSVVVRDPDAERSESTAAAPPAALDTTNLDAPDLSDSFVISNIGEVPDSALKGVFTHTLGVGVSFLVQPRAFFGVTSTTIKLSLPVDSTWICS